MKTQQLIALLESLSRSGATLQELATGLCLKLGPTRSLLAPLVLEGRVRWETAKHPATGKEVQLFYLNKKE